jgi:hypothetical protein
MAATITLTLTRAEAQALYALVSTSAEQLFVRGDAQPYALEWWSPETAARACDKLQAAVMPQGVPAGVTWTRFRELKEILQQGPA